MLPEINVQSHILESLASAHGVNLVYSLSPGGHDTVPEIVSKGRQVSSLVSMYRVNNDDWDNWPALADHFDVAAAFAKAGLVTAGIAVAKSVSLVSPPVAFVVFGLFNWLRLQIEV